MTKLTKEAIESLPYMVSTAVSDLLLAGLAEIEELRQRLATQELRENNGTRVFDQLLAEERAMVATLRSSAANAEAETAKATQRAEKAEGERAVAAADMDAIDNVLLAYGITHDSDATLVARVAGLVQGHSALVRREKAALTERDAARAELAAMRAAPTAPKPASGWRERFDVGMQRFKTWGDGGVALYALRDGIDEALRQGGKS